MINIIIRLWGHLTKQRKIQFFLFLILTVIGSIVEVVSLGAIIPFLAALSNPEKVNIKEKKNHAGLKLHIIFNNISSFSKALDTLNLIDSSNS